MNQNYIKPDPWSIIEEEFVPNHIESSESLFSLGNGAMGQRANFEEHYSGTTFQGNYIAGVYYPDKTKVGWWKNGYPEYFAKVLNAPNWIGINVLINGESLDLFTCRSVESFKRELNMKEGWLSRSFIATLQNNIQIKVSTKRFLSLNLDEIGAIKYNITPITNNAEIELLPYLDSGITNKDSNWDDKFWDTYSVSYEQNQAFIQSKTMKTDFNVCTFMESRIFIDNAPIAIDSTVKVDANYIALGYKRKIKKGETYSIEKIGGYTVDRNYDKANLVSQAKNALKTAVEKGFNQLIEDQKLAWATIWDMADITISGDIKAQQGIRFNIFQLNQTYSGKDSRLNIGPKGFTGEKYGGSTYWDTEAYCIPFYMATKNQNVARNLLVYRYNQLDKAIENAKKIGLDNGAALFPMVTMNGEECHNEWEITFEEIHRNGAIAYAIYNYTRYTGDYSYIPEKGLEVLIGIARFWHQRASFSKAKKQYVILGVTGPNEYENNIDNNWYTNYIAQWCLTYTLNNIEKVKNEFQQEYSRIIEKVNITKNELDNWKKVSDNIYFPYSEENQVYLQHDGFLDKELVTVDNLPKSQRPINQNWSWDRILRSPYIKQADTLQGFYFFEDHFSNETLERHFDFYEPFTVHESSLSPCVHSILAAKLNRMEQAYTFYLRTSRLDLDDYNHEVHEGLHITSMAGTWMSIVEGFGGMRVKNNKLSFTPKIPKQWDAYSFKINFRNYILKINITQKQIDFELLSGGDELEILINNTPLLLVKQALETIK